MESDKQCLVYDGYTFFHRYYVKKGQKWVCTTFPRCKAYLCVDDNYYIIEGVTHHSHAKRALHKCASGKYVKTYV